MSTSVSGISQSKTTQTFRFDVASWAWVLLIALSFVLVFWPFLRRMVLISTGGFTRINPDWGHIVVIPFISLFFVLMQLDQLRRIRPTMGWWGLPIMLIGMVGFSLGIYPIRNDMFQGVNMVITLLGLVLLLFGPAMMRLLWFPVVYLLFMIKISDRIWELIAFKLQITASELATGLLMLFASFSDFDVTNDGSTIKLSFISGGIWVTESLNVAEACAGLRMLMAFIALGVAVAYLWCRPSPLGASVFQRVRRWPAILRYTVGLFVMLIMTMLRNWRAMTMLAMTIPIAIAVNVGRVTILGLLYLVDRELAQGAFHTFVGMLMLIPGLLMFVGLMWLLENLIIDETPPVKEKQPLPVRRPTHWAEDWQGLCVGALIGLGLSVIVAGLYFGPAATLRPSLLNHVFSATVLGVVTVVLMLVAVWIFWRLPRWTMKIAGGHRGRQRAMAVGMVTSVLLISWIGQSSVLAVTKFVLIRKPVPLVQPLHEVPQRVGPWELIREHPRLSKEMQDELGTEHYFSRTYADQRLNEDDPGYAADLHVAYYTGTTDTVPHVPDRCFLAAGVNHEGIAVVDMNLPIEDIEQDPQSSGYLVSAALDPQVRLPSKDFDATLFTFSATNPITREVHRQNVLYFFLVNGKILATPDQVRLQGFDPRDEYGYYCKVEVRWPNIADSELARQRTETFLAEMLPEILACVPDWVEVKAGYRDDTALEAQNHGMR